MLIAISALVGALALVAAPGKPFALPAPEPQYLFDLASMTGASESTWASVAYDREHDELFTVHDGLVHIFNSAGMETFRFGGDGDMGLVQRVALVEGGDLLLLTNLNGRRILRTDYRGELLGPFEPKPLPEEFAGFDPDQVLGQGNKLYLVETPKMRVVVTDLHGKVEQSFDLASQVRKKDPEIKIGMNGFWADPKGNFFFTMPYAFTAFARSPTGELRQFGSRGSSPGKFNIVGAIATDERGTLFILDRLRSVVLVFDPSLRFVVEFGYRGDGPSNLIAPFDLGVGNGKVFVSQARNRGVKAYQYEPAAMRAPPDGGGGG
jgi:hypothetical protein